MLTFSILSGTALQAQVYDDLYFDPDQDTELYDYSRTADRGYDDYNDDYRLEDEYAYNYDADEYDYYNDYDFYYTSRIRRFHRPVYGFGYYDPIYTDVVYYDPFLRPGLTTLIYDDWAYRSWTRNRLWNARRFNRWGGGLYDPFMYDPFYAAAWGPSLYRPGFNVSIGFGNAWGWNNPWNRWNRWNRGGLWGPTAGFGGWGGGFGGFGGFSSAYYCPPTWGNNFVYANNVNVVNNNLDNQNNNRYGPRTGGSTAGPRSGVRSTAGDRNAGRSNRLSNNPNTVDGRSLRTGGRTVDGTRSAGRTATSGTRSVGRQPANTRSVDRSRSSSIRRTTPSRTRTNTNRTRNDYYNLDRSRRSATPSRSYNTSRRSSTLNRNTRSATRRAITPSRSSSRSRSYTPSTRSRSSAFPSRSRSSSSRSYTPSRSSSRSSSVGRSSSSSSRSSSAGRSSSGSRGRNNQ